MDDYTPKYIIIKNYIIEKIKNEELKVGDKIPSENQLSKQFNVSRVTANAAIKELSTLGIVERVQGKGTFVGSRKIQEEELYHELNKSIKISSESLESKHHLVEDVEVIEPSQEIMRKLKLAETEKVYKITRFMIREEAIIALDYSYIPLKHLPDPENVNFERLSSMYLHDFLSSLNGMNMKYIHIHIDAKLPNDYEVKKMKVGKKYPLVIWDTNILDSENNVIAYTTTIADPKKYRAYINFEI